MGSMLADDDLGRLLVLCIHPAAQDGPGTDPTDGHDFAVGRIRRGILIVSAGNG